MEVESFLKRDQDDMTNHTRYCRDWRYKLQIIWPTPGTTEHTAGPEFFDKSMGLGKTGGGLKNVQVKKKKNNVTRNGTWKAGSTDSGLSRPYK